MTKDDDGRLKRAGKKNNAVSRKGVQVAPHGAAAKPISLHPLDLKAVLKAALDTPAMPIEAPPPPKKRGKVKTKKARKK